jgi:hypothetical protein
MIGEGRSAFPFLSPFNVWAQATFPLRVTGTKWSQAKLEAIADLANHLSERGVRKHREGKTFGVGDRYSLFPLLLTFALLTAYGFPLFTDLGGVFLYKL